MIHESGPWKERLAKDAEILDRWSQKANVSERRSALIEQKIFLAAYSMRKLYEAEKLSSSFDTTNVRCEVFKALPGKTLTKRHRDTFTQVYDLQNRMDRA
jgi:hypothetical protein